MTKPIKALGMALFAAVAMFAVADSFSRRPKGAAADYEEFTGSSLIEECTFTGGYMNRATTKVSGSIQIALVALVEFKVSRQRELNKPITLGTKCYVSHRYSLDTEQLTASFANSKTQAPSEICDRTIYAKSNNNDVINFSYEKTQLNSCLA